MREWVVQLPRVILSVEAHVECYSLFRLICWVHRFLYTFCLYNFLLVGINLNFNRLVP